MESKLKQIDDAIEDMKSELELYTETGGVSQAKICQTILTALQHLKESVEGEELDQHRFMALLQNVMLQQMQIPNPISSDDIRDICQKRTASILELWKYVNTHPTTKTLEEFIN